MPVAIKPAFSLAAKSKTSLKIEESSSYVLFVSNAGELVISTVDSCIYLQLKLLVLQH